VSLITKSCLILVHIKHIFYWNVGQYWTYFTLQCGTILNIFDIAIWDSIGHFILQCGTVLNIYYIAMWTVLDIFYIKMSDSRLLNIF